MRPALGLLTAGGGLLVVAFFAGWLMTPSAADLGASRALGIVRLPSVRHPQEMAASAHARFSAFDFARAPRVETVSAPPAPPPPDIGLLFRRDLTAIERTPKGATAWIVDLNQFSGHRGLSVGDIYRDGWRVSDVTPQYVELRKRREVRRVSAFDLPQDETP